MKGQLAWSTIAQMSFTLVLCGLGLPPAAPVLFALGRFIDKKGFADLLHALARLPAVEAGRAPRLLLAGDGPQRPALEALVHELRLDGHVHFLGWQPQPAAYFQPKMKA